MIPTQETSNSTNAVESAGNRWSLESRKHTAECLTKRDADVLASLSRWHHRVTTYQNSEGVWCCEVSMYVPIPNAGGTRLDQLRDD